MSQQKQTPMGFFLDLAFNLVIPVMILQKLSSRFGETGPLVALVVALSFPLSFGFYDLIVKKKRNLLSILGFINILFTGSFALMGLTRNWYIAKELLLPTLIGIYVWSTSWRNTSFIELIFFNESVFNMDAINKKIGEKSNRKDLKKLMLRSTQIFATTFLVSAAANFFIAGNIFTDIPYIWTSTERAAIRNYEIAEMKKWHYIVLLIPSLVMTVLLLWHLVSGLTKITGLKMEELVNAEATKK
ncbi:MAG: hypothetical protein A4S09_06920 [Proteobacteria bacterium SG_bin7]|nr:MAG: hypothetical protein A4S09_06920 [Proteobacteria bacterium SG_bin7]